MVKHVSPVRQEPGVLYEGIDTVRALRVRQWFAETLEINIELFHDEYGMSFSDIAAQLEAVAYYLKEIGKARSHGSSQK